MFIGTHALDSSSRLCFLPRTFLRRLVASILRLRPSVWSEASASLVAVVLGLVSESCVKYERSSFEQRGLKAGGFNLTE